MTASGNVSEHSTGSAVDIAAVNGIPIIGHQGPGSITELTIQRLLTLQGTMKPHQIISLMKFDNTDNTFAMGDHADHIHVGFRSLYGSNSKTAKQVNAILKPKQWIKLIDRLGEIDNPTVRRTPSRFSLDAKKPGPRVATPTRASSRAPDDAGPVTERRFGFVQWEFAGRLGPDPGRYHGAPVRRRRRARDRRDRRAARRSGARCGPPAGGAKAVAAPEQRPVEVTRATVIDVTPLYERDAAEAWLERRPASGPRRRSRARSPCSTAPWRATAWPPRTRCWPTPTRPGRSSRASATGPASRSPTASGRRRASCRGRARSARGRSSPSSGWRPC